MTDKEKIKAIIKQYADKGERLLEDAYKNDECASTTGYWDGYKDCADDLLRELEVIQEEPESHRPKITLGETTGKLKELLDNMKDSAAKDLGLSEEDYNKAIDECLYGKEPELVDDEDLPKEEPASEELDEAAKRYATEGDEISGLHIIDEEVEAFNAGANWQKEKLMAKAVDIEVKVDAGGYPYIPQIELYDYDKDEPLAKEGDKYKVILIKED